MKTFECVDQLKLTRFNFNRLAIDTRTYIIQTNMWDAVDYETSLNLIKIMLQLHIMDENL